MVLEIIVFIAGSLAIIAGIVGCVVPVLPGPLLSFLGLIFLSIPAGFGLYSPWILLVLGGAALVAQILDNILPALSSKRAGASKAGVWGSVAGMLLGMIFFPPVGVFIGAFVGALAAELILNPENREPLRAAMGVFTGTLLGIVLKLAVAGTITVYFVVGAGRLFR